MLRKTDLQDIFFPVELRPLFLESGDGSSKTMRGIPHHRAVVNDENGRVLGIVGKDYRLIKNEQAIELGKQCCMELLGFNEASNLKIFNVLAPATRSYCHIDLVHSGFSMNLWGGSSKPDIYIPFVRVTNSYNTTRALRFDVGFCRKLCLNGTIFEVETVRFIYSHIRHDVGKPIRFDIKKERFDEFKKKFIASMKALKDLIVPKDKGKDLLNILLRIPREHEIDKTKRGADAEYSKLIEHITKKSDEYFNDMGENAYALFNAISDVASNPPQNIFFRRDTNSMQKSAGNWVNDLKEKIKKDDFNLDAYIKELSKQYEQGSGKN